MVVVTLLSDFGLEDPYVAEMKAVILSINPKICIVDITHEIEKFNIRRGAFILASAAPYFPSNTIHVAVVDPGVGTRRRPIIAKTKRSFYVGPDNGLLMLAAHKEGMTKVYQITNPKFTLARVSKTFHGRDIFAPVAAHLGTGTAPFEFGPVVHDYVSPEFGKPRMGSRKVMGEVLHVDGFGNIISNISEKVLERVGFREMDSLIVKLNGKTLTLRLCSAYGEVPAGTPLAIIDSSNFLEVAINQGSASRKFNAKIGDTFYVSY